MSLHLDGKLRCTECGRELGGEDYKALFEARGAVGQSVYFVLCLRDLAERRPSWVAVASGW